MLFWLWKFVRVDVDVWAAHMTIGQCACGEKENAQAGKSLLNVINSFDQNAYSWSTLYSDEMKRLYPHKLT